MNDPLVVFDYEVDMLINMYSMLIEGNSDYAKLSHHLKNAVVESAVLHTRNLADILLSRSRYSDDIRLSDLLCDPPPEGISPTIAALEAAYGKNTEEGSPCWAFNKKLAHSTKCRTNSYDYSSHLKSVVPLIVQLACYIHSNRT